jgi:hypothetical protein
LEDLISKKAEDLRSNIKADNELPDQMETEEDNSLDSTPRKRNESRDNHLGQGETSIKEST